MSNGYDGRRERLNKKPAPANWCGLSVLTWEHQLLAVSYRTRRRQGGECRAVTALPGPDPPVNEPLSIDVTAIVDPQEPLRSASRGVRVDTVSVVSQDGHISKDIATAGGGRQ